MKPPPEVQGVTREQRRKRAIATLIALAVVLLGVTGFGIRRYLASAPQRAGREFNEGVRLITLGHYALAVDHFDRAIRIEPRLAEAYYERGLAHQYLQQVPAATADFEKTLSLKPGMTSAADALGLIFSETGNAQKALNEFNRSLQTRPSVDAYYQRGQVYESMGQHQKAIDDFTRAAELLPDAPYVYRARSLARRNLGDMAGYAADRDRAAGVESRQ